MNGLGTRYSTGLRGSRVVIEQYDESSFRLLIDGKQKATFGSAERAREKLIAVIAEQTKVDDLEARRQVPVLGGWNIETIDLFRVGID